MKSRIHDYRSGSYSSSMLSNPENMKYRTSEPKSDTDVLRYIEWGIKCAEQNLCVNFWYAVVIKQTG